eukprot:g71850.t1
MIFLNLLLISHSTVYYKTTTERSVGVNRKLGRTGRSDLAYFYGILAGHNGDLRLKLLKWYRGAKRPQLMSTPGPEGIAGKKTYLYEGTCPECGKDILACPVPNYYQPFLAGACPHHTKPVEVNLWAKAVNLREFS